MMMKNILILYNSQGGSTKKMSHTISIGVESTGATATILTLPNISAKTEQT
ncbi:tryptophan repressor-binding protein, partial [Francisella tularensis subsp. holarctica]|nr:tryptophan repressor-binding protein [Francisella tularensis subsp. holarctica]